MARNPEQTAELEAEVAQFLSDLEAKLDALEDLPPRPVDAALAQVLADA